MTTELYVSPQPTRSARAHWAFLEAKRPFTPRLIDVFAGEQKTPAYLKVHPLGQVPAATFDGQSIHESAALSLIAATGTPLLPEVGTAAWRAALQWVVFAPAELDHLLATLNQQRLFTPPPERDAAATAKTIEQWDPRAQRLSEALGDEPFLLGKTFSIADVCVGHSVVWAKFHDLLPADSSLQRYLDRCSEREAFQAVYGPRVEVFADPFAQ